MNTTTNSNNNTMNTMKTINKVDNKVEKARKYAIMAISGLLEDTRDYPNKEYNTTIMGYDLDWYENEVTKVYKKGKQVRVTLKSETFMVCDEPINILSSATILMILEDMLR